MRHLYPWHRLILRLIAKHPGITTLAISDRYYPIERSEIRLDVTLFELRELNRKGFLQCCDDGWSLSLAGLMALKS